MSEIKVGQIYKIDNNDIGIIYNYDEKLPYIDVLFLEGLGVFIIKSYIVRHQLLIYLFVKIKKVLMTFYSHFINITSLCNNIRFFGGRK